MYNILITNSFPTENFIHHILSEAKVVEVEDHSNEDHYVEPLNSNEMQKICDELKQNRDWDTVIKQWKQTMSMRRDMISQSNDNDIQTVLQEWPLYKFSRAPELVTIFVFFKLISSPFLKQIIH